MYVTMIMSEAPVLADHFPEKVPGMRAVCAVFDEEEGGDTVLTSEKMIKAKVLGLARAALNTLRIMGRIK